MADDDPRPPRGGAGRLRWVGLALVVLAVSSWVYAAYFLGFRCGDDCGDQGGRGVLLGAMAGSGFGLLGIAMIKRSSR